MKQILFPTDFSENSEHALPFALEVARLFDAELTLFNAYKLPYSKSNLLVSMKDRMKTDTDHELEKMKDASLKREKYQHLKINTRSVSGGFVSSIPRVAVNSATNMIVMSTKGASGLKEMFIGSNTLEVIQSTSCPVLAIPENAVLRTIDKIAFATDFREIKDPSRLQPMFDIAKRLNLPIEFVNVIRAEDAINSEEKAKHAIQLEKMAEGIRTSIFYITNEDIINGLSEYIVNIKPDMLVMLSRKHTLFERLFLKSITNKLSFRTEIPLLVLDE